MAVSQNGWPASAKVGDFVPFAWVTGRVRPGDTYTVLNYLARRFNAEVEGIEAWQSWGWNYRDVRGAASLSNHASGTAVDFNATRHPLSRRGTFSPSQVAAIRRILAALNGVVRWGGDYTGRADEMHFEINASSARVAAVARAINAGTVNNPIPGGGTVTNPTIPAAPTPIEEDSLSAAEVAQIMSAIGELKTAVANVHAGIWTGGKVSLDGAVQTFKYGALPITAHNQTLIAKALGDLAALKAEVETLKTNGA